MNYLMVRLSADADVSQTEAQNSSRRSTREATAPRELLTMLAWENRGNRTNGAKKTRVQVASQ